MFYMRVHLHVLYIIGVWTLLLVLRSIQLFYRKASESSMTATLGHGMRD